MLVVEKAHSGVIYNTAAQHYASKNPVSNAVKQYRSSVKRVKKANE